MGSEWNQVYTEINQALKPLKELQKKSSKICCVTNGLFLVVFNDDGYVGYYGDASKFDVCYSILCSHFIHCHLLHNENT